MSSRVPVSTTPSAAAWSKIAGSMASLLSGSVGPTTTNRAGTPSACSWCAASSSSTMPFSRTSRPTTRQTTSPSAMPHSERSSWRASAATVAGSKRPRSTPLPSNRTLRAGMWSVSTRVSTSSGFWTSSTSPNAAAIRSAAYTGRRRCQRSVGCAHRPCWVLTTSGVRVSRAAIRPRMPGLGLWVCTMSGRSVCSKRTSWPKARRSWSGLFDRVNAATSTCSMPIAVRLGTCGPAADMPMTS